MLAHIVALLRFKECTSVQDYVHKSKMDLLGSWGTDIELLCFAHLTNTCVFTYITVQSNWERFGPHNVDRNLPVNDNAHSVYLCLKADHYELVGSTVKFPNSGHSNCPTVVDLTKESDITKPDSGSKESWPNSKPKEKIPHSEIADPAVAQAAFAASVGAERVARQVWSEYRFHCVDQQWQADKCSELGLPYHGPSCLQRGGPNVLLTRPNRTKNIGGDGNCLFRCFSYVVTGSQEHYQAVRAAMVAHMPVIPNLFTTSGVASVQEYLNITGMADNGTWGNRQEVSALCHLLHTPVYAYDTATNQWEEMTPGAYSNPPYRSMSCWD